MKIVKYPHPALRHKAKPLPFIDKEVRLQAERMLALMYEAKGLGLAANQVAWPFQLLVINDTSDPLQKEHEHVVINPVLVEEEGWQEGEEGCLSFPELFQKVRRRKKVTVQAYNLQCQPIAITCSELAARLLQHEIDHLEGKLFIDRMGPIGKMSSRGALRSFEHEYKRARDRGEIPSDDDIARNLADLENEMDARRPLM